MRVPQGYLPADSFTDFVRSEYQRYGRLIKSIGVTKAN
jgi:tripartite-type tricarboxylate transporter receptor subunit TctC